MRVLAILCTAFLAIFSFSCSAAAPTTADVEFNPKATEWVEGVVGQVQPDGHFQVSGTKSGYASEFAEYQREYYSFPETERELQRKQLQERFHGRLNYPQTTDKALTYSFSVPNHGEMSVFDESGAYGNSAGLWTHPEKPATYKYGDLKAGDRVVVGYDSSEQVYSIYRVNPVVALSGESNQTARGPISDEVDKNGVHIMNKSSNETNPVPTPRPNTVTRTNSYGNSFGYDYGAQGIGQTQNTHQNTENNPTSPPNVLNDARNEPANSLTPSAPRPTQTGTNQLQTNQGGRNINSSDGSALNARAQEQQTNPSQFNNTAPANQPTQGRADNAPANSNGNTQPNNPAISGQPNSTTMNGQPNPANNTTNGPLNGGGGPRIVPQRGTSR